MYQNHPNHLLILHHQRQRDLEFAAQHSNAIRRSQQARPPRRRRRIAAVAVGVACLLARTATAEAADCAESTAAFPAGSWTARGVSFLRDISDGVSTGYLQGDLAFNLEVSTAGLASGSYTGVLTGQLDGITDASSAGAVIIQSGTIGGTGARAEVTGTTGFDIDASIDVAGADGVDFFTGGASSHAADIEFEQPYATVIVPSLANCGEAIGNLSSDPSAPALFIATRADTPATDDVDLATRVVEYLAALEVIDAVGPPDAEQLAAGVELAEGIDAAIAAQDSCQTDDLGSLDRGGSTRNILSLLMADNLYEYAEHALGGEYTTVEVISVYTTAIRGALFGGRAGTCVADDPTAAAGLRDAFERVLMQRWSEAVDGLDRTAQLTIEAAAAQLNLANLLDLIGASR